MRTLPESASLDHLRRQAKELLAIFHRREPDAALGEAQAALAREYGRDQLVVTGWDYAGAVPPDWEMASALMAWSETIDGAPDAVPGQAFLAAYRAQVEAPDRLELRMFSAGVSATLNWTATRVAIALDGDVDGERRATARRALPGLLVEPLSLDRLEQLVDALAA